jgi:hypothetical protein
MPPSSLFLAVAAALCGLCGASMTPAARRVPRSRGLYDGGVTQFAPDGTLHQVEYAKKAVDRAEPALAAIILPASSSSSSNNSSNATSSNRAGGGIVLAARVLPQGPKGLLLSTGEAAGGVGGGTPGMPTKLHVVDDHVVCAAAGVVPDAIALVAAAREAAAEHRRAWGCPIGVGMLARRVANQAQAATQYGGRRPFGASLVLAGWDDTARCFRLAETDPSGNFRLVDGVVAPASAPPPKLDSAEPQPQQQQQQLQLQQQQGQQPPAAAPRTVWTAGVGRDSPALRRRFEAVAAAAASSEQDPDPEQKQDQQHSQLPCLSLPTASSALERVLLAKGPLNGEYGYGGSADNVDEDDEDANEDEPFVEFASIVLRPLNQQHEGSTVRWVPTILFTQVPLRQTDLDGAAEVVEPPIEMLP